MLISTFKKLLSSSGLSSFFSKALVAVLGAVSVIFLAFREGKKSNKKKEAKKENRSLKNVIKDTSGVQRRETESFNETKDKIIDDLRKNVRKD